MQSLRFLLLSTLILAATAAPAAALRAPEPRIDIKSGHPVVSSHLARNQAELESCAAAGKAASVKARVKIRWDRRGRARSIRVSGGTGAFRRCVRTALAGTLPIVKRRAGSGSATFVVKKPAVAVDLHSCQVDSDCTLHFQMVACVASDPVAVNTLDPDQVLATYPVRRLDCAMGGPQYDELRRSNQGRWTARCEQSKCTVHDAGSQPSTETLVR